MEGIYYKVFRMLNPMISRLDLNQPLFYSSIPALPGSVVKSHLWETFPRINGSLAVRRLLWRLSDIKACGDCHLPVSGPSRESLQLHKPRPCKCRRDSYLNGLQRSFFRSSTVEWIRQWHRLFDKQQFDTAQTQRNSRCPVRWELMFNNSICEWKRFVYEVLSRCVSLSYR